MVNLDGKVAVVTGAASGIGRALAERFVRDRMKVVLADLEPTSLGETERALREAGGEVLAVPTDVSDGAAVDALAARAFDTFGAVHLLCNNAGVGGAAGPMWTLTERDWQWTLGANLWGVIHGIRAFVPRMIAGGAPGHVVNTASAAGLVAPPLMGPYVASKHAVVALSEVLVRDLEMAGAKIGVSVLCPAWVRTRIAESARQRPAHLRNQGAPSPMETGPIADAVARLVAGGSPPSEVADAVAAAVREGRFYVLPHAEVKHWARTRFDDVLGERNPRFDPSILVSKPSAG